MTARLIIVIFSITLILVESYDCGLNTVLRCNRWSLFPVCRHLLTCDRNLCGAICVCKADYVRNTDGTCQPRRCPANSSLKLCMKIDEHQCERPITTNIDGLSAAECVCDPGYYWFNEFEGCMTLAKLLKKYSYQSRSRFG